MSYKQEKKSLLVEYIHERVQKRNKNFGMVFVGPTGSGKSYSALRLAEMIDPTFDVSRVKFKAKDFMNVINDLVEKSENGEDIRGKVIMWDEMGVEHDSKKFMSNSNRIINYFFQTSRHLNLVVIMTVPLLSFIDSSTRKLMHSIGQMQGINQRDKTATVKVKMLQVDVMTGKEYPKYIRFIKNNKMFVNRLYKLRLPSKKLLEDYEREKKAFTTQLNKDIMRSLEDSDEKSKEKAKHLTHIQEKIVELLRKHSTEEVATILNIQKSSVYAHKTNIEKKNYSFKPIWVGNRVQGYEITKL